MPETWGECGVCRRWFYCEEAAADQARDPLCPVCGQRAVQVASTPPQPEQ